MKAIFCVASKRGDVGIEDANTGDVVIKPTIPASKILMAGGSTAKSSMSIDGDSGYVNVRNFLNANAIGTCGITFSLIPGIDKSTTMTDIIRMSESNPYAWASNAVSQALIESDYAWNAANYASNALYMMSGLPDLAESILWASNQAGHLVSAPSTSNIAVMVFGIATQASNDASIARTLGQQSLQSATYSSNTSAMLLEITSNQLTMIHDMSVLASNAYNTASYSSNNIRMHQLAITDLSAKSTSAYLTATNAAGFAAWASNAAGISAHHISSQEEMNDLWKERSAEMIAFASNQAISATDLARISMERVNELNVDLVDMDKQIERNKKTSAFSCNLARIAMSSAATACNLAMPASQLAQAAVSNADAALSRVLDTVSSSHGGMVLGDLCFRNQASLTGVNSIGVGTESPHYPIHVISTAPNSTVSMWLAGDIHTLSDARDKREIRKIDSALDKLLTIGGYTYKIQDDDRRAAGVVAQEVSKVLPEAVHKNEINGKLSVAYNCIIPLLIEAIRELHDKVVDRA